MSFVCCPDEGVIADVQLQASPNCSQYTPMLPKDLNFMPWVGFIAFPEACPSGYW